MVESIYFLKPAWCGTHFAGLWPEQGLQPVTRATALRRWFVTWAGSERGVRCAIEVETVRPVIPLIPLRTAFKIGHEESMSYVAMYQRLGRISHLFTIEG